MLFRRKEPETTIKPLQEAINEILVKIARIEARIEALELKYNTLRASLAARSRKSKIEELAEKAPEVLEQLGYEVIRVGKRQEMQERNNNNK